MQLHALTYNRSIVSYYNKIIAQSIMRYVIQLEIYSSVFNGYRLISSQRMLLILREFEDVIGIDIYDRSID